MASYIATGEKRDLTPEEMRAKVLATGYSYIPTGGLPVDEAPKPSPAVSPVAIKKPTIVAPVKPGTPRKE